MSYNGYIIISILVGLFGGFFIFEWRNLRDLRRVEGEQVSSHC
jgi:hypothetical protein